MDRFLRQRVSTSVREEESEIPAHKTSPILTGPDAPDMSRGCVPHRANKYRKTASELAIASECGMSGGLWSFFGAYNTPGPVKSSCQGVVSL